MAFDPYHKWLGIRPKDQPPHHYRLLGIDLFEDDAEVLAEAAERRLGHLAKHQSGEHVEQAEKILAQITAARDCLCDPIKKAEYDAHLRQQLAEAQAASESGISRDRPHWPEGQKPANADELKVCVLASGLLTRERLAELLDTFTPQQQTDKLELAKALVHAGGLTKYQIGKVYAGHVKMLLLGDYEILDEIGEGGMGKVYKARHRRMDRLVALKVLPPDLVQTPEHVARFHQEVRTAARLIHQHIVTAFDAGDAGGVHYLVMEYVDGHNLGEAIEAVGPMEIEQAVEVMLQAAHGLSYAHSQGVIHRDIKPSNLLCDKWGRVKILTWAWPGLTPPREATPSRSRSRRPAR